MEFCSIRGEKKKINTGGKVYLEYEYITGHCTLQAKEQQELHRRRGARYIETYVKVRSIRGGKKKYNGGEVYLECAHHRTFHTIFT